MNKQGKIAVANKAVIKAHGKYLILLKSDTEDVTPNSYDLPGGRMEYGEQPQEALKREAKEEANLDIEIKKVTDIGNFIMSKRKLQLIRISWACTSENKHNKVNLSHEHSQYYWKDYQEIQNNKSKYPDWLVTSIEIAEQILSPE